MKSQPLFVNKDAIRLNPDLRNSDAAEFETRLSERVVGQERAVRNIAEIYQLFQTSLATPAKPLGNLLFLGPTGSGKTFVVESTAQLLFGTNQAVLKIDCAEFQHSHEIAKLIGSPPGYLGHRETLPLLSQEALNRYRTPKNDFSLVLFDEIEKASDSLWQLLLGILDKGILTLGDNRKVDFSKAIIFMTSNLGAREIGQIMEGSIGFAPVASNQESQIMDDKIYRTALEAAKRRFSPEFMNRIDSVVVFRNLTEDHFQKILDLELSAIQERIFEGSGQKFFFHCTEKARQFFLREGIHPAYGARNLKRVLERELVVPMANLIATSQVATGDLVTIDFEKTEEKLIFFKHAKRIVPGGHSEAPKSSNFREAAMAAREKNAIAA